MNKTIAGREPHIFQGESGFYICNCQHELGRDGQWHDDKDRETDHWPKREEAEQFIRDHCDGEKSVD